MMARKKLLLVREAKCSRMRYAPVTHVILELRVASLQKLCIMTKAFFLQIMIEPVRNDMRTI